MASDMNNAPLEKKGSRFSRLLGKREKSPNASPGESLQPTIPPDSAYASSETPSGVGPPTQDNSTTDIVPAEKNSDIGNIDKDRNLGVRPATGEVLDRDTGEVVTVVTTTTTTTTTTTRKPGQNDEPHVAKDVKKEVHQSEPTGPAEMPTSTEKPVQPAITQAAAVPDRDSSRTAANVSPPVPDKSQKRVSEEYRPPSQRYPPDETPVSPPFNSHNDVPASPNRPNNFSYPARNRNSMDPERNLATADQSQHPPHQPQHQGSSNTIANLTAAAKGLHGVGETLRGTLNSTIDQNFPRKNADKAAVANAKNDAVMQRGRNEMENINNRPDQPRAPMHDQTGHGQWRDDDVSPDPLPTNTSAEAQERERQKAKSIGKLFKRKPVGREGNGELRERSRERKYY